MNEWKPITQLSFDDWIAAFFDNHPIGNSAYNEISDRTDPFKLTASTEIEYLTQLFETAEKLLGRYSNDQVNASFWYLMGNAGYGFHHK